jgi:hypothetical protein
MSMEHMLFRERKIDYRFRRQDDDDDEASSAPQQLIN